MHFLIYHRCSVNGALLRQRWSFFSRAVLFKGQSLSARDCLQKATKTIITCKEKVCNLSHMALVEADLSVESDFFGCIWVFNNIALRFWWCNYCWGSSFTIKARIIWLRNAGLFAKKGYYAANLKWHIPLGQVFGAQGHRKGEFLWHQCSQLRKNVV